jgi:hypothetical protein
MGQGRDDFPNMWVTAVRWSVFVALVAWAIITWDRPDGVILPAIVGGIILVASLFINREKSER